MENTEQKNYQPGTILLRARDVAKELSVSRTTAYRLMKEKMPYYEFTSGIIRVSVEDLMEYKEMRSKKNRVIDQSKVE